MYRGITLSILILIILAALYVPVRVPYALLSVGSILPCEEWRLMQETGGGLSSMHQNNKTGIVQRLASWQFERGDLTGMEVTVRPDTFGQVICGDTVVRMYSSIIHQQILELDNRLKVLQSEQQVLLTGEKAPIVQEAESELVFAKEALTLREKEYAVAQQLLAEGVIAKMEFNRAENVLKLAKIEVITAEKGLAVANTGVKSESVGVNAAHIQTLQKQIAFLRARNAGYVITSPFDGVIAPIREVGEVMILQKINECIVTIPVKTEEMSFITDSCRIEVTDPITQKVYVAHYLGKEAQTQVIGSRSVAFVRAAIYPEHRGERITLGISAQCSIQCGELNQREYLKRLLRFSVSAK